jgi:tetratricopeptide (TPR) repeat protein
MKKSVYTLFLVCLGLAVGAQSTEIAEGDSIPWEIRKQSFIYNSATMFNDANVAKMALYNLIAENPGNPALFDSLALIYLRYNQPASAVLVAQQSLKINPNNLFATEIAANGFDNLGVKDRAIPYYETLYLSENDLNVLYKIAFLQLETERFGEAITSIDIIMNNEESETKMIVFPTEDNQGQEVPLKVAAHRIKAMVEEAKGNEEEAKKLYLATLQMYPGFQIVQSQLQLLSKKE